jgi:hypothetical protein
MAQQLLAMFIQSFVASLVGGYGGYRYAIRNAPPVGRPSGSWQLSTCLLAGIGGAALAVAFKMALTLAFASAETSQLAMIPLLFGFGISMLLTQRFLKSGK